MAFRKCIEFTPDADFCIYGAIALLLLPLKWIIAAAVAAAFHEFSHYLALRLCGVRVYGITVSSNGAVMETEAMTDGQELLCALAGPAGSFLLLLCIQYYPEMSICALIHGLYNLLPVFPLDGGRAVRSFLGLVCPRKRERLADLIQWGCVHCIVLAALTAFFYLRLGFGVLLGAFLLLRKALPRKIPCKAAPERVQ